MKTKTIVSWEKYAQKYDLLLGYNPFYQQLHRQVLQCTKGWEIEEGDQIADLGAGTGNYSLSLAQRFPQADILHVDSNQGMNAVTLEKKKAMGICNHRVLEFGIEDVQFEPESLRALVSIHALYAFPDPQEALKRMYRWLQSGGDAILVDAGRIVRVLDWQIALGWHLLRQYGWRKALEIMRDGKEVSRQNAYIREMQRKGLFWTHSHEEFCETVQNAGFEILDSSIAFRGISDFVIARKK